MKGLGTSVTPVTAGVRVDIERLLQKFIETPSVRFAHFSACFREAKFSLIFSGRSSENEMREFSEKLLMIALTFCFPPYNFHVRVGGLYLVYSLYYLQPKRFQMQIRITTEQVEGLKSFLTELMEQQHLDTCYVWHKLFRDNAFYLCAFLEEHNPLNFHRFENKDDAEKAAENLGHAPVLITEFTSDPLVSQLESIHDQYVTLKKGLVKSESLPRCLAQVDESPMSYINNIVAECEEKLEKQTIGSRKTKPKQQNVEATPTNPPDAHVVLPTEENDGAIKDRRKAIKERAYHTTAKQQRHRRHRQEGGYLISATDSAQSPLNDSSTQMISVGAAHLADNLDNTLDGEMLSPSSDVQMIELNRITSPKRRPGRPSKRRVITDDLVAGPSGIKPVKREKLIASAEAQKLNETIDEVLMKSPRKKPGRPKKASQ